ncbi:MAG: ParB/RepB/Spo0J family partition protein [Candidatus Bathyarchaeia archaeon]|jgi:ParB/RepB/Spo0J family partition protein
MEASKHELILVGLLQPNRFNPNVMQATEFHALRQDMELNGPEGIDPVLVSPYRCFYMGEDANPFYVIVDGEHRWKAAKELCWNEIRCEVRELNEQEAKVICYRKNKDRGTIDPLKEAALFKGELDLQFSQKDIAEMFLVDQSTVSQRLSLLKLVPEVLAEAKKFPRGNITVSHLEPIASLPEGEQKKISLENRWEKGQARTVREITDEVHRIKEELAAKESLRKALETAKFPKCPKCKQAPSAATYQKLPWVRCSSGNYDHTWNLDTGKLEYESTSTSRRTSQPRPEVSNIIRSNFTIDELSEAFFKTIHAVLPKLDAASKISITGLIDKTMFIVSFDHGPNGMHVYVDYGGQSISFGAEPKQYHTGQKSKIDMGIYQPKQADLDRHLEFIENAFKNILLPLPEKKPKRLREEIPAVAAAEETPRVVPCESCSNDSDNGGSCHREQFHVVDGHEGYFCEHKKPLERKQ